MERILRKQFLLTGYLECLLRSHFSPDSESKRDLTLKIITPEDPRQRGSQLSLVFSREVSGVHKKLEERAIVVSEGIERGCVRMFTQPLANDFALQTTVNFVPVRLPSPERDPNRPRAPLQLLLGRQEIRGAAQKHRG